MRYHDGSAVSLGDIVTIPVPSGTAKARVVMLGDSYAHLSIDERFLAWVTTEKRLKPDSVVIEWLGPNPLSHSNLNYAPVGNYMFTPVDQHLIPDPRPSEP
jgi:hypothetical protein